MLMKHVKKETIQVRLNVNEEEWSLYKLLAAKNGKSAPEALNEHISQKVSKLMLAIEEVKNDEE